MQSHSLVACVCLALLLPWGANAQEPNPRDGSQSVESSPEIPTFYAHSRQVIVEAEVWNHVDKKNGSDASWIPQAPLEGLPDGGASLRKVLRLMPPPARGLTVNDFHVFDNGVEQRINYFKEDDFPATSTSTTTWRFDPSARGIWGTLIAGSGILYSPSATYLMGYVPPAPQPGECRTIQIVVQNHYVQVNRKQYCTLKNFAAATTLEQTKLGTRMQSFAKSTAQGKIKVSMQAFAFWSSGVLSLARRAPSTGNAPVLPAADFTYVVEVHDSKAPATVQIAATFALPEQLGNYPLWNYPCPRDAAIHVLAVVYKTNGELVRQFDDAFRCDVWDTPMSEPIKKVSGAKRSIPSLFDTQIELRPGDYEVRVVVSDGKNFGRAQVPLRVQPLNGEGLTVSDVALNSILRDASWIVRDAAKVAPASVIPAPLVSKNVQFLLAPDTQLRKDNPLSVYFEIYERLLETQTTVVSFRLRITDLKTGSLVMDTEPMSAANWVLPGNVVIPIGLKLGTEKLGPGSYRLEVRASDSAGRETPWRQATFTVE